MSEKRISVVGSVPYSTTWVDGAIIFKGDKKWSKAFFGICAYSRAIFACTPSDYQKPLMIATINVSHKLQVCDRASTCLHFKCALNRFQKSAFYDMFIDCAGFTLGMPLNIGSEPLWFNQEPYISKWEHFIIKVDGGILRHKGED